MTNTMAGRKTLVLGMMLLFAMPLWAQEQAISAPEETANPETPPGQAVYRSVDSQGNVVFTDRAPEGRPSAKVTLPQTNAMPAHVPRADGEMRRSEEEALPADYTRFEISSPAHDEYFGQDVEGVGISLAVEPGVQDGHSVQLFLNGQPVGEPGDTYYDLSPVDRGTYTVTAKLYDAQGEVLMEAKPVQFHVRRISVLDGNGQPKDEPPKKDPTLLPGGASGVDTGDQGASSAGGVQTSGKLGGTAGSSGGAKSPGGAGSASGVGGKR